MWVPDFDATWRDVPLANDSKGRGTTERSLTIKSRIETTNEPRKEVTEGKTEVDVRVGKSIVGSA